ncbi:unnamed protein product, partial [marine sediment metagenome]
MVFRGFVLPPSSPLRAKVLSPNFLEANFKAKDN